MTEKEYIERDKIGLTDFEIAMCNGDYKDAFKMLLDKIESIPAADVRPVVRGKWIMNDECRVVCSLCGNVVAFVSHPDRRWEFGNFCPNCGADMREANDEKA